MRKAFHARLELFRCVLFVVTLMATVLSTAAEKRPNIIIILADDMGYGDLGCYGHPSINTPHLDRMADEGMRFTDFYVAAAVCTPSRAALLTGRLPIRNGMAGTPERSVLMTDSTGGLPTNEVTIASALKTKGYVTACIGKWHLGHLPQFLPTRHGFDYFFGVRFANNMEPAKGASRPKEAAAQLEPKREWWKMALLRNEEIIEHDTDPHQLTARYTKQAIDFIKQNKSKPFFLYLPHTYPHTPLFASEKFRGKSARGIYGDTVEELDWSVGEILSTLRKEKLAENTFVFFFSDNGPSLSMRLAGGSAGVFRDGKGDIYEGGVRVPAIAWWPKKIKPGIVSSELISAMDLFNTSLHLAGVPLPKDRIIDGVDLRSVLFEGQKVQREMLLFYRYNQIAAVRKGVFKGHLDPSGTNVVGLYHLGHDPAEKFNVVAEHPGVVRDLLREVEVHRKNLIPAVPQY